MKTISAFILCLSLAVGVNAQPATASSSANHIAQARQIMDYVQKTFWNPTNGWYNKTAQDRTPDYVWRQAAAFSALVAAARYEPATWLPILNRHFHSLDKFWDTKSSIPGYEPAPTRGNGHDKYYDDNAWLVITFLEAYQLTTNQAFLVRARETAQFVLSGWDDKLGGGIWWHAEHKDDSKNTCANGPAALGFLYLARWGTSDEAPTWLEAARKTVDWTTAKLQDKDGLYDDRVVVTTGEVKRGKLTYNSALMLRSYLGLYRLTGRSEYLEQAKRIGKAADWFTDKKTGIYRDPLKWSQFMVEADLDLYRATGDETLLHRARLHGDAYYAAWRKQPSPEMMANVGTARILWLLADTETSVGRAFWKTADQPTNAR